MTEIGSEELMRKQVLKQKLWMGEARLPGTLVTGGVISSAKNGWLQQAAGVLLLLKGESNKKVTSESM